MLVLVGTGESGKTTLARRLLLNDKFDPNDQASMTDGIEMSNITIGSIEFKTMDFAGQKEYTHTHALFFTNDALYVAVVSPRSGNVRGVSRFLQMVEDFAPDAKVILVSTRADDVYLSEEDLFYLLKEHPCIVEVVSVDSISGKNIPELREKLESIALELKFTHRKVPSTFISLGDILVRNNSNIFSITYEEFERIGMVEAKLDKKNIPIALKLLCMWGVLYQLSSGDIVLHPQQLADVLACVVSRKLETLERIGFARDGLLNHDYSSLAAIWGPVNESEMSKNKKRHVVVDNKQESASSEESKLKSRSISLPHYDEKLWRCRDDDLHYVPDFLSLLYKAGLAYRLYDEVGQPMSASLVPAMLPDQPPNFPFSTLELTNISLYKHFFCKSQQKFVNKQMMNKNNNATIGVSVTNISGKSIPNLTTLKKGGRPISPPNSPPHSPPGSPSSPTGRKGAISPTKGNITPTKGVITRPGLGLGTGPHMVNRNISNTSETPKSSKVSKKESRLPIEAVTIGFKSLPSTFVAQIQVRLRNYAMIGGAWSKGCAISIECNRPSLLNNKQDVNDSIVESTVLNIGVDNKNTNLDRNGNAVLYCENDSLVILVSGSNRSARSIILDKILTIKREKYPTLRIQDFSLSYEMKGVKRVWTKGLIEDELFTPGYLYHKSSNTEIPLYSLKMFLLNPESGLLALNKLYPNIPSKKESKNRLMANTSTVNSMIMLPMDIVGGNTDIKDTEGDIDDIDGGDDDDNVNDDNEIVNNSRQTSNKEYLGRPRSLNMTLAIGNKDVLNNNTLPLTAELALLETVIEDAEREKRQFLVQSSGKSVASFLSSDLLTNITLQLLTCIPIFKSWLKLTVPMNKPSVLWVLLKDESLSKVFAVPLSPKSDLERFVVVESAAVVVEDATSVFLNEKSPVNKRLLYLLRRALCIDTFPAVLFGSKRDMIGFGDISNLDNEIMKIENECFENIEGVMVWYKYTASFQGKIGYK